MSKIHDLTSEVTDALVSINVRSIGEQVISHLIACWDRTPEESSVLIKVNHSRASYFGLSAAGQSVLGDTSLVSVQLQRSLFDGQFIEFGSQALGCAFIDKVDVSNSVTSTRYEDGHYRTWFEPDSEVIAACIELTQSAYSAIELYAQQVASLCELVGIEAFSLSSYHHIGKVVIYRALLKESLEDAAFQFKATLALKAYSRPEVHHEVFNTYLELHKLGKIIQTDSDRLYLGLDDPVF